MICDSCIHKEVCYEMEEDRRALKHCSDYFNFEEELEKIKTELNEEDSDCQYEEDYEYSGGIQKAIEIIDKHISELKGEQNV